MNEKVTAKKDMGLLARLVALIAIITISDFLAGCTHPPKLRDIELKGMYVNGVTETVAIGSGRLTSIPGEREALAAHYYEDSSWVSPSIKTHALDIFLVGSNTVSNSEKIIASICKAFSDVAPTVSATNAEVAKGGTTVNDLLKASGEVRKAVDLVNAARTATAAPFAATTDTGSASPAPSGDSADCADCAAAGDCTDCVFPETK